MALQLSAVPCVEEPERMISKGPDRGHCSPKLLLRERLRETGAGARNQTGAIMTMHHLLTIVIAMLQEQLLWHDRHIAIHSLFAQAEKKKRG